MSDIQVIESFAGTVLCISCTFWLELKYQHEESKNTKRIREMGLSSSILGCACTREGSWLTSKRTCKNRFWVCKFKNQILVLTVWTRLYWRDGWCISRTVRPAGRLNFKLCCKGLSFNLLDKILRFAMPSHMAVLGQDGARGCLWSWCKYSALPVSQRCCWVLHLLQWCRTATGKGGRWLLLLGRAGSISQTSCPWLPGILGYSCSSSRGGLTLILLTAQERKWIPSPHRCDRLWSFP